MVSSAASSGEVVQVPKNPVPGPDNPGEEIDYWHSIYPVRSPGRSEARHNL
jgi:hypothetical protein